MLNYIYTLLVKIGKNMDDMARIRYRHHKGSAIRRGIEFKLTFDEWYNWYLSNGVDKNQPYQKMTKDTLCMCRYNDTGAYELSNIYIDTNSNNVKLRNKLYWSTKGTLYTPFGNFSTIKEACESLKMTRRQISYRMKTQPNDYYFK